MKTLLVLFIMLLSLTISANDKDTISVFGRPTAREYSIQMAKVAHKNAAKRHLTLNKRIKHTFKYYERRRQTRINNMYYQYNNVKIKRDRENPYIYYENWNRRPKSSWLKKIFK